MKLVYNTNDKPFVISKKAIEEMPDSVEIDGKTYNKTDVIIYPYTKAICQAVVQIVPVLKEKEITYEELCAIKSERGKGSFGSSNK